MNRCLLWPRHEVFDLVIPALSQCGRALTNSVVLEVIKQVFKVQTPDHFVSFDRWVIVAKDFLKWNDACIRLFWEMLHIVTWSQSNERWTRHTDIVLVEHLALFLVLHIHDTVGRPSSPTAAYDTIWPTNDHEVMSPHSPTSPTRIQPRKVNNSGSPKSPRNSSSSISSQLLPASPKRSQLLNSKQYKSASQILNSIRQKIPLLLRAVATDDCMLGVEGLRLADAGGDSYSSADSHSHSTNGGGVGGGGDFLLSKRSLNALSLVLGGSVSWNCEQEDISFRQLSSLYQPSDNTNSNTNHSHSHISDSSRDSSSPSFAFSDLCSWIDLNLITNDTIYPQLHPNIALTPTPPYGSPTVNMTDADYSSSYPCETGSPSSCSSTSPSSSSCHANNHTPVRTVVPMGSAQASKAVAITGFSSTMIYQLTSSSSSSSSSSSIHQAELLSDDIRSLDMVSVSVEHSVSGETGDSGGSMSDGQCEPTAKTTGVDRLGEYKQQQLHRQGDNDDCILSDIPSELNSNSIREDGDDDGDDERDGRLSGDVRKRKDQDNEKVKGKGSSSSSRASSLPLPHLSLQGCHRATIYLLAPFSSASISGCTDCTIVVAAVTGAVHLAGCERVVLTVACAKAVLRNCLDCDIRIATLSTSIVYGDSRGITFAPFNCAYRQLRNHLQLARLQALHSAANNNWSSLCDVAACLDSPPPSCSPSGYALDVGGEGEGVPLPVPQESTAMVLSSEKFSFISIPIKAEHQPAEIGGRRSGDVILVLYSL
eukprot:gene3248-6428_t